MPARATSSVSQRLAEWLDVREGEGFVAVGAFSILFGIVAGHTILETARDAIFLSELPANQLTLVYAAVALGTWFVAGWNTRFVGRFGQRNALVFTLVIGSFVTVLLHFQPLTRPILFLLYGWSALIGAVLTAQFWMYAAQLFTVAQGKRLFSAIASGAVLGGVFGASGAALVIPHFPLRALLLASAAIFFSTAVFLSYLPVAIDVRVQPGASASEAKLESGFWTLLRKIPYLRLMAAFTLLGTATLLVTDYLFKSVVASRVPAAELGSFFAKTYAALNIASLLVQFFLTRRILRRVGVVPALVVLPLLLAFGSASMLLFGGALLLALFTKGVDGALRYSLQRVASELLWLPLSSDLRAHVKAILDTVFAKITQATVAAGLFVLVLLGLGSPRVLALIAVVLSVLWLGTTVVLRQSYLDLFRQALSQGSKDLELDVMRLDLGSLEVLLEALSSRDARQVIAAMDLLSDRKRARLVPSLILYHEAEDVLVRALAIVATPDRKDWVPLAARLLQNPSERLRIEVVRALSRANEHGLIEEMQSDPSLTVRAHAALMRPTPEARSQAVQALLDLAGAQAEPARVAVLAAIFDHPEPVWNDLVLKLAQDAGTGEVFELAARVMTKLSDPRFIPWLLPRLGLRERRPSVRDALVQQGEPALDALAAALLDPSTDPQVRLHIPRTISRFASQRAADLLLEVLLNDPRGLVRYKALRGLGRLVADTTLVVDPTRVEPEIRKNLIEVLRITALEVALGEPQAGLLSGPLLFGVLSDKRKQALERAFRFLQIAHRHEDIRGVYAALVGDLKARRAQALEFLDALTLVTGRERRIDSKIVSLRNDIRELLVLVGDDLPARSRVARAVRFIDAPPTTASQALQQLVEDPDQTLAELAASYQGELRSPGLRPRIEPPRTAPGPEGLALSRTSPTALPIWAVSKPARELEGDDEIPRLLFLKQLMGDSAGSVVSRLARQMTTQRFGSGETLYQALTPSTAIFFVRSGEVMQQGPGSESRRFLAPSVMGGLDALDGRPHLRTTVAVSDVEALVLTREDWLDTLEDQFEFARQFMDLLCRSLARSLLAPGAAAFPDPTPPGEPRSGFNLVERLLLLRSVEAFELAAVQSLALVAQIGAEIEYRAGDIIEAEGALAERLWVVASGQVEVSRAESAIFGRMGPGQLVSGPASLGFKQQLFSLQASVPTTLLSIPYSGLFDIMEDHFDLTLATLLTLGNAVDRMPAVPRNEGAIEMSPTISDAMKKS